MKGFSATRLSIFIHANLEGAQLQGARFSSSIFSFARLANADLSNADMSNVYLGYADLNGITGWETAHWQGANIIGVFRAPDGFVEHVISHGGMSREVGLVDLECPDKQ